MEVDVHTFRHGARRHSERCEGRHHAEADDGKRVCHRRGRHGRLGEEDTGKGMETAKEAGPLPRTKTRRPNPRRLNRHSTWFTAPLRDHDSHGPPGKLRLWLTLETAEHFEVVVNPKAWKRTMSHANEGKSQKASPNFSSKREHFGHRRKRKRRLPDIHYLTSDVSLDFPSPPGSFVPDASCDGWRD